MLVVLQLVATISLVVGAVIVRDEANGSTLVTKSNDMDNSGDVAYTGTANNPDDDHHLTDLYLEEQFGGKPVGWVTQQQAEGSDCITINYNTKKHSIRSINQHADSDGVWFRCDYFASADCDATWVQFAPFPTWHMEREAFIVNMDQKVRSVKCHYPVPGSSAEIDDTSVGDAAVSDVTVKRDDSTEEDDYKMVTLYADHKYGDRKMYHYFEKWVSHPEIQCRNFMPPKEDAFSSIKQFRSSSGRDYSCMYYAKPNCNGKDGSFGKRGEWSQEDLSKQPKLGGGNWNDKIESVECWWVGN